MEKRAFAIGLFVISFALALLPGCVLQHEREPPVALSNPQLSFPSRPDGASTGSEFLLATADMEPLARERAILAQVLTGNVPSHIRQLAAVHIRGQHDFATVYVTPDYLAVGSDQDYVIIPMTYLTAQRTARYFGFILPTRKLVDAIYENSDVRLVPEPLRPGPQMTSNAYYQEHDRRIKRQLLQHTGPGGLIVGHKKDLVLTPRLLERPHRVAIYGWHRLDGTPIQPLSLFHHAGYVDYSHGVRLVSRQATLNGASVDLLELLADPELYSLFSDEGQVSAQSYL
jgi:hypothetical protein